MTMSSFDTLLKEEINLSILHSLAQDLGVQSSKLFAEGVGSVDILRYCNNDITAALLPAQRIVTAQIITKEDCLFVGRDWIEKTFTLLDPSIELNWHAKDGDELKAGSKIVTMKGDGQMMLIAERTALNFAQTLSGTATTVKTYAQILSSSNTKILDTRKTIPGMRYGQKYAVTLGGGVNHRIGLYDRYLIKENHIIATGSILSAVELAKSRHPNILVEIEVESLSELKQAIEAQADIVMLDNFTLQDIVTAVELNQGQVKLEVSGNVEEARLKELAHTGVDYISSGALTKHVKAVDLSLRLE